MTEHIASSPRHVVGLGTNIKVFVALLVLLALTITASRFDLGPLGVAIAITIAAAKALLIILYFMHVRYSHRLAWVMASAGFVWLAILIGLTMSDYVSRGWFGLGPAS